MHWGRLCGQCSGGTEVCVTLLSQVDPWMHPKSGGLMDARMHPWHQCRDSEWGWGRGSEGGGSGKQGGSREAAEGSQVRGDGAEMGAVGGWREKADQIC